MKRVLFSIFAILAVIYHVHAGIIREYDDEDDDQTPQAKFLIPFFNATAFWQSKHSWKYPQTTSTTQATTTTASSSSSASSSDSTTTSASTTTSSSSAATTTTTAATTTTTAATTTTTPATTTQRQQLFDSGPIFAGFAAIPPTEFDYIDPSGPDYSPIANVTTNRRRRPYHRRRPSFRPVFIYKQPPNTGYNPWSYFAQSQFWR